MSDDDTARKAVKVLDIPGGDKRLRPVHTIGIGASGYFVASDVARDFCAAEFFGGQQVRVSVRFSNGKGLAIPHDGWNDTRGLAVRFHLAGGAAADLLAMTLSEILYADPGNISVLRQGHSAGPSQAQIRLAKVAGHVASVAAPP